MNVARFVRPGAVRIASTSFGTTGWNGQVMDVAFRNPDGSTVLVAHNENDNPSTFGVREGDQSFSYTLPGGALATFTWHGTVPGTYALRQVSPRRPGPLRPHHADRLQRQLVQRRRHPRLHRRAGLTGHA